MKNALMILVLALPFAALAQTYRWVDAKGGVHFTQIPPRSGPYTIIGGAPPPAASPNQDSLNESLEQSLEDAPKQAAEAERLAQELAQRQERCRQAIERLAYLEAQTPRRMATTSAEGEVVRDSDAQFQERLAAQRGQMKDNCD